LLFFLLEYPVLQQKYLCLREANSSTTKNNDNKTDAATEKKKKASRNSTRYTRNIKEKHTNITSPIRGIQEQKGL